MQVSAAVFISLELCNRSGVYLYASGIEYHVNSYRKPRLLNLCNPVCVSCHRAREPWVASVTHAMCIQTRPKDTPGWYRGRRGEEAKGEVVWSDG